MTLDNDSLAGRVRQRRPWPYIRAIPTVRNTHSSINADGITSTGIEGEQPMVLSRTNQCGASPPQGLVVDETSLDFIKHVKVWTIVRPQNRARRASIPAADEAIAAKELVPSQLCMRIWPICTLKTAPDPYCTTQLGLQHVLSPTIHTASGGGMWTHRSFAFERGGFLILILFGCFLAVVVVVPIGVWQRW